jgi:hypothetical protein
MSNCRGAVIAPSVVGMVIFGEIVRMGGITPPLPKDFDAMSFIITFPNSPAARRIFRIVELGDLHAAYVPFEYWTSFLPRDNLSPYRMPMSFKVPETNSFLADCISGFIKAHMISMLTRTARLESMATPCSIKTRGRYLRCWPRPCFMVTICDLRNRASSSFNLTFH